MNLRQKIILLATVPLVIAVSAITLWVTYQEHYLSEAEVRTFERSLLDTKKSELKNYIQLALTSIDHIYSNATPDDQIAKAEAKTILNDITFGTDGYFFVYDFDGEGLVHPAQPYRVGLIWWDLEDANGDKVVQNLIRTAREGGGYHRYKWEKPSTGKMADKISYVVALEKWGWMLGTGIYIDDVVDQMQTIEREVSNRRIQTFFLIAGITLAALTIVFVIGIIINLREQKLADLKLKKLTQRIVATQEEERGRVARELHDGISQLLVSVKYALELAKSHASKSSADALPAIEKGSDGLNTAIKEVRRISRDLRPSMLDDLGLSPALKSLANEFSERTGINVAISTVVFRNLLPNDVKTTLFRIAQETLTNIERHADAANVDISLSSSNKGVELKISDDGVGFDLQELETTRNPHRGMGLRNMQERLEYHDGSLKISSGSRGTTIIAHLPRDILRRPDQGDIPPEPADLPDFKSEETSKIKEAI
ncbi:cache domain-containing protein [Aestuariispira insulae]|uniref:histidine kinase n=1 Tax=Aestuariispira insulae TaxID=1461337 RepID=A0A3D9HRU0_9PROT|nr:cache domain-containing protein [Aestuariispira insulae]RED52212.1 two-component system NarL family sensor kinase [Aestuariispira insulae]